MDRSALAVLAAAALSIAACSSDEHEMHVEPPAPPLPAPWQPPAVEGVEALEDTNPDPNIVEVTLTAERTTVDIGGKKVPMLGFNGMVPGPMLKAKVGDEVIVHFTNSMAEPTTIHWHGLRIPDTMDGSPRIQNPVMPGAEFTYRFKVPEAASFWYHPHVKANVQIEAGLYAPIAIWDPAKDPTFDAERFLMIDDVFLDDKGKIPPEFETPGEAGPGRYGNTYLTNGRLGTEARATVEQGTVERWRIVNTANARTMQLELVGASFRVIGTDGGLLPQPYTTKRLTVAIGQRYDLEVTYDAPGTAKLTNYVLEFDEATQAVVELPTPAFTVDVTPSDRVPREIVLPEVPSPSRAPTVETTITLDVAAGLAGNEWRINGMAHPTEPIFTAPEGTAMKITIRNNSGPPHPFHLHGQFFEVLDKKQPGLKDVVLVNGQSSIQIVAYLDNPGRWMAHCHILEHAELGMMGEIIVLPKDGSAVTPPTGSGHGH